MPPPSMKLATAGQLQLGLPQLASLPEFFPQMTNCYALAVRPVASAAPGSTHHVSGRPKSTRYLETTAS